MATLGATLAYDILVAAQAEHGVIPVTYEDDVHPYSDLALGRVDAVVLDAVLAERGVRRNAGLMNQDADLGVGHYVGVLAPGQSALRDRMNGILREAMRDGRLEAIFRHWEMWNEDQPRLYARVLAGESVELLPDGQASGTIDTWEAATAVPARAASGGRDHAGAVVRGDGARGRRRQSDRDRPRLRTRAAAGRC